MLFRPAAPPCTENVLWVVLGGPLPVSAVQVAAHQAALQANRTSNSRPVAQWRPARSESCDIQVVLHRAGIRGVLAALCLTAKPEAKCGPKSIGSNDESWLCILHNFFSCHAWFLRKATCRGRVASHGSFVVAQSGRFTITRSGLVFSKFWAVQILQNTQILWVSGFSQSAAIVQSQIHSTKNQQKEDQK